MAIEKLVLADDSKLFSFLFQAVPPGLAESASARTAAAPLFWVGLAAAGEAPWPGSAPSGVQVRLARGADGGLFSVEDGTGLLLLAAFGFDGPGESWAELNGTVDALRLRMQASVVRDAKTQGIALETGVQVEWPGYGTPPERGAWLVLVPMLGLGAYPAEDVLEQARTIGLDLLVLYGPASV